MGGTEKAQIFCFSICGLTEEPRPFTPNCIMFHVQTHRQCVKLLPPRHVDDAEHTAETLPSRSDANANVLTLHIVKGAT